MSKILIDEATVALALGALEKLARLTGPLWALENNYAGHLEAITALREDLAQPSPEIAIADAYRAGVVSGIAAEREAISDEWSMCIQSDLEHGVKSLNEQASKDWFKNYPEIAKFGAWLSARSNT